MQARSPNGNAVPPTSPAPLPVPPRWHLRTQVSRKTLFDLIQETLPPAQLQVPSGADGVALEPATDGSAHAAGPAVNGVVPQAYPDALATTVPMPLNPAALWADGDTTPDLPEPWRPITITLASLPVLPPPAPRRRSALRGVATTAGWMLSGAALTFLAGAAAFGSKPMLRAIRTVMAPQVKAPEETSLPATQQAPVPPPAPERPRPPALALADGRARAEAVAGALPSPADARTAAARQDVDPAEAGRNGATSSRGTRRPRAERRVARWAAPPGETQADTPAPDGGDAVMPLAAAEGDGRPAAPLAFQGAKTATAPARPRDTAGASAALARTNGPPAFRPIDVEDPFGVR